MLLHLGLFETRAFITYGLVTPYGAIELGRQWLI